MKRKYWILSKLNGWILNVGCGNLKIDGVNLDHNINVKPDILADFHSLPFRDKAFDYAVAFDILEHSHKPSELIKEMERVSKKQVIEVLDFDKCPGNWAADSDHKYYINRRILEELLPDYQIFEVRRMLFGLKGFRVRFPYLNFLWWRVR